MKALSKIALFLLVIIVLSFFALVFGGCKAHRTTYDKDFLKYYESINDTIIAQEMARELDRIENNKVRTIFQVINVEVKPDYIVYKFQYSYSDIDRSILGGTMEVYLNKDNFIKFKMGRHYNIDFTPSDRVTEPMSAPDR